MSILTAFGFLDRDTVKESIGHLYLFDIVNVNLRILCFLFWVSLVFEM